jgi:hypothetical protein
MRRDHPTRRAVLGAVAASLTVSAAGCSVLSPGDDATTTPVPGGEARALAERFAPTLYFDEAEVWFPTDPRPYASERDGETVVDGFDALNGYTEARRETEAPEPTVFYHAVSYADSPLTVVQFWFYAAFDQFTTNFHWHDWEVLHVFVDTSEETPAPQLHVASSHSRKVPNNEFLDPDPERTPRVLAELGSHSSALSLNDVLDRFQRLPTGDTFADVTNSAVSGLDALADLPFAYGLPRDEGGRLPFLVPELDGAPVYDHERLPAVSRDDLIEESLTVRSLDELTSPPEDLPLRGTGRTFGHVDRDAEFDVGYDLAPTSGVEDVDAFVGPQLSFEFAIPKFAEDAVAGHITSTSTPWSQPRYTNPAADITDPRHRQAMADRYEAIGDPAPVNAVLAVVGEAVSSDNAPDGEGLTTGDLAVEAFALLESEPEAVPSFSGVVAVQDVPEGEHRLIVNAAGTAPHSETVGVAADGPTAAGVEGEIPLVARENATKLAVDGAASDDPLTRLAVEDDFAGRLYDAPLDGEDAVYVHRGGAYTTEVRDENDEVGAFRVNPDPAESTREEVANPRTGKAPLATYVADVAAETAAAVRGTMGAGDGDDSDASDATATPTPTPTLGGEGGGRSGSSESAGTDDSGGQTNAVEGLARALEAVAEAARRAAERAAAGDRGQADRALENVQERLTRAAERLSAARGDLPTPTARAADRRLEQAQRRGEQARGAGKL